MDVYKSLVESSFRNAENDVSKLPNEILTMEGITGTKTRHFYNNLLTFDDARYLVIGTWKGSSVCSAMCNNKATVVCIDNWSEFGGPENEFLYHFNKYKGENNARFIENDCFKVDVSTLPRFNIYMYDGNHSDEAHHKALVHYYDCLDDTFIFIVDDWNWKSIRVETLKSIQKLNFKVLYEKEIRTTTDDTHPEWGSPEQKKWHNGIYVTILQKQSMDTMDDTHLAQKKTLTLEYHNNKI